MEGPGPMDQELIVLCEHMDILSFSFSPTAMKNSILFNNAKSMNIRSLDRLVSSDVMKRPTAENIAGSGLHLDHHKSFTGGQAKMVFVTHLRKKNSHGLPRVTNSNTILEEVIPKLCQFFFTLM